MAAAARETYLILGGGFAGYSASNTLRLSGFEGRIVLVGAEAAPPYERPPLSKAFLQGKKFAGELVFQPASRYEELGIEMRLGRSATGVDFDARQVTLDDGEALGFDKLLIATGANPIRPRGAGFDLPGVHYLRTVNDAEDLMAVADARRKVVVVGAGFIGSEVAASLRTLGHHVTLVDSLPYPLTRPLGERMGAIFAEIHRRHGVDLRMNERVSALHGDDQVREVELASGERVDCDLVIVGVGVRPATEIFAGSKLEIDNGIVCDERCETNIPGVFAAGDIARWWHAGLGQRLRVEHYDNAGEQGAAAARAMLGGQQPYTPVPYFWSDQYDVNLQYVGYPIPWDDLVLRGDVETPSLTAFYLAQGVIVAAATVNRPREQRSVRRLVEAGARIDPGTLTDPATDLRALSRSLV